MLGLYWQPGLGKLTETAAPPDPGDLIQYEVETILMRQLASYLATPIYIVGAEGQLLYFNAAAERVLGRRFDEIRVSSRDDLYEAFRPSMEDGSPLKRGANPLTLARERREPAHLRFCLRTDGGLRTIEGTAFPLIGHSNRVLGAAGIFWEIENS